MTLWWAGGHSQRAEVEVLPGGWDGSRELVVLQVPASAGGRGPQLKAAYSDCEVPAWAHAQLIKRAFVPATLHRRAGLSRRPMSIVQKASHVTSFHAIVLIQQHDSGCRC
jgi:hypothetical protein